MDTPSTRTVQFIVKEFVKKTMLPEMRRNLREGKEWDGVGGPFYERMNQRWCPPVKIFKTIKDAFEATAPDVDLDSIFEEAAVEAEIIWKEEIEGD